MNLKNIVKITLIAIVVGIILTVVGCSINGGFTVYKDMETSTIFDNSKVVSKSEKLEEFNNIEIDVEVNSVEIIPSDKYFIEVKYIEGESYVNYEVKDNTLKIKQEITSKHKNYDINVLKEKNNSINLYVPKDSIMESIKIDSNVANIYLDEIVANKLSASCDVGNIEIQDSIINKELDLSNDVGNIDVEGKIYGVCNVKNNIGNIELDLNENKSLYNYVVKNSLGIIELDGENYKKDINVDNNTENNINLKCETGRIGLSFK